MAFFQKKPSDFNLKPYMFYRQSMMYVSFLATINSHSFRELPMKIRVLLISLVSCLIYSIAVNAAEPIDLKISREISHKALLFQSNTRRAAVLVHQSGATMQSWVDFAKKLAERGTTSIALDSITPDDVIAAINYLITKDYTEVVLIGASIGGGAITQALAKENWEVIKNVVLLSPSIGPEMKSNKINKLVLVSTSDFWGSKSYATFEEASAPKSLKEYEGIEHGQALLSGKHTATVHSDIFNFLKLIEKHD